MSTPAERAREWAEHRLAYEAECDLGHDDDPCDECLRERKRARDVLALAAENERLREALRMLEGDPEFEEWTTDGQRMVVRAALAEGDK